MRGSRGKRGKDVSTLPIQNHKNIGLFSNSGSDPLKNHNSTKPEFNVGPSSTRQ